jgi:phosphopantothenoylcysteine decarboxylase / phosphopantothenate---cysteine ligase
MLWRVSSTIVLGITGSIAAYKAVEIARLFRKAGHRVIPVMTASATKFVGAVTLSGICGEAVRHDMWDSSAPGEMHVELAALADLVLVAPATADVISRFASGRADDLLAALVLCRQSPLLLAPAMHPRMWNHPATQRNVVQLGLLWVWWLPVIQGSDAWKSRKPLLRLRLRLHLRVARRVSMLPQFIRSLS